MLGMAVGPGKTHQNSFRREIGENKPPRERHRKSLLLFGALLLVHRVRVISGWLETSLQNTGPSEVPSNSAGTLRASSVARLNPV